jgi:hypothetical protein
MSKCGFYRLEPTTVRAHTSRADRREPPPRRVSVPWCAAPEVSPLNKARALAANGTVLLGCGGDLALCPIADKLAKD